MILNTELDQFLNSRPDLTGSSLEMVKDTTARILKRTGLLDGGESKNCQLVVGEVQSGKTTSFTALIASARDHGFPIIIVLAGTKLPLLEQTRERLRKDLQADGNGGINGWFFLENVKKRKRQKNIDELKKSLAYWQDANVPAEFKQTVVIPILKHKDYLNEVKDILGEIRPIFDVANFPILIVDDEGDQASLNLSWASGEESTTYAAIHRLRDSIPKHSYVMYTATPQGPLLISIADTLSPDSVTLLESGVDYVGGEELFSDDSTFTHQIPEAEQVFLFPDDPHGAPCPITLKQALAYFVLAMYVAQKRGNPKPLSMLIHPHYKKSVHKIYEKWTIEVINSWKINLADASEDIFDYELKTFFRVAEEDLRRTVDLADNWDLRSVLLELPIWMNWIEIRVSNSDRDAVTPTEWKKKPAWILIGGNQLDRGYTVEKLAVTYMPRALGVGNADTLQQRGRFFGYKRPFKDLLRGWFFYEAIDAYQKYVEHEKSIRESLAEYDRESKGLKEWRRRFLLDPALRPVRQQVISLSTVQKRLSNWKQQMLFADGLKDQLNQTLDRVYEIALDSGLKAMPNDLRLNVNRKNFYTEITREQAFEILTDWPMSPENRIELDDIIWALGLPESFDQLHGVNLVLMDWNQEERNQATRERRMTGGRVQAGIDIAQAFINNLFQGPDTAEGSIYPGDDKMVFEDKLTIQVHKVMPKTDDEHFSTVAALAVLVPKHIKGFVVETSPRT
jgi:hypothetical protein